MADVEPKPDMPGVDSPAVDALLRTGRFFTHRETSADLRAEFLRGGRARRPGRRRSPRCRPDR
ncbi:MAG: hypothetical protein J2P19_34305 [Pseudonocardia sp.]|nr:hypothetical protein [Pseudonocardia sp.]